MNTLRFLSLVSLASIVLTLTGCKNNHSKKTPPRLRAVAANLETKEWAHNLPEWKQLISLRANFLDQATINSGANDDLRLLEIANRRRLAVHKLRGKLLELDPRLDVEEYAWKNPDPKNSNPFPLESWAPMPEIIYYRALIPL